MTALPPKSELDGSSASHNQGVFKAAIGGVRDFLAGLFGGDGTPATAFSTLKLLDPQAVYNLKPVFTVGANALTCTIKDRAGTDLAVANPAFVGQRSATAGDGGFNLRAMTANVALTISSGSTLGHSSAVAGKIYWYLLDNAGAQVLAACGSFQGFSGIYSTTAEGGAGAADSDSVLYAVAAHSSLPGRLIAVSTDTQTTAGTWVNPPTLTQISPETADRGARILYRAANVVLGTQNKGDTIVATAAFTQTIAAAAALGDGWYCLCRNDGSGLLTLDPNAAETIDSAATLVLASGESCLIVCDGSSFKTIGRGLGNSVKSVVARSADTILTGANKGDLILATNTFTQTMTAAATLGNGWYCRYRNDGSGIITLDPSGGEAIDGAATLVLGPGSSCMIVCDGLSFKTVGLEHREFVSAAQTITSGGTLTIAHFLGADPVIVACLLTCAIAEGGYSIGQQVWAPVHQQSDSAFDTGGVSIVPSAGTSLIIRFGSRANVFTGTRSDTGAGFGMTNANWTATFIARRR